MKTLQALGWMAAIVACAAGGVLVGRQVSGAGTPRTTLRVSTLDPGAPARGVELNNELGQPSRAATLIARGSGILLFVDPKCPPCQQLTRKWQEAIRLGYIGVQQVAAVSRSSAAENLAFKREQGFAFPVLSDPANELHRQYGITMWPVEVLIANGSIVSIGGDYAMATESPEFRKLLRSIGITARAAAR